MSDVCSGKKQVQLRIGQNLKRNGEWSKRVPVVLVRFAKGIPVESLESLSG